MSKLKSILEQSCPEGKVWCPIQKTCISAEKQKSHGQGKNQGFGKGKGPIGIPKQEQKIDQIVDEAFDDGFDRLGQSIAVEKKVDEMLDKFDSKDKESAVHVRVSPNPQGGVSVNVHEDYLDKVKKTGANARMVADKSLEQIKKAHKIIKKSKLLKKAKNAGKALAQGWRESEDFEILACILEDDGYKQYFKDRLKDKGYDSLEDVPDEEKKTFFRSVDKGWKAQDETEEQMTIKNAAAKAIRAKAAMGRFGQSAKTKGGFGRVAGRDANISGGFGRVAGTLKKYKGIGTTYGESKEVIDELDTIDKVVLAGAAGGAVGLTANHYLFCRKRFPEYKNNKQQQKKYMICMKNPWNKDAQVKKLKKK